MYNVTRRGIAADGVEETGESVSLTDDSGKQKPSSVEQFGPLSKKARMGAESEPLNNKVEGNVTSTTYCPIHGDDLREGKCYWCENIRVIIESDTIKVLNETRSGKKLLVLDLDLVINDRGPCRSLYHKMLASAYKDFDMAFWSTTDIETTLEMVHQFMNGTPKNSKARIAFALGEDSVLDVVTPKGTHFVVKPLDVVWSRFPQYSCSNTICIDKSLKSYLLNLSCGLWMSDLGFDMAKYYSYKCKQVQNLSKYLRELAKVKDFRREKKSHAAWERKYENISEGA